MITFVLRKNGLSKKDEQAIYRYLKKYKDRSNVQITSNLFIFSEKTYGNYLKVFLRTFNPQSTIPFVNE